MSATGSHFSSYWIDPGLGILQILYPLEETS